MLMAQHPGEPFANLITQPRSWRGGIHNGWCLDVPELAQQQGAPKKAQRIDQDGEWTAKPPNNNSCDRWANHAGT